MRKAHIIYFNFISKDQKIDIGGIETYIQLLAAALCTKYDVKIYFPSKEDYAVKCSTFEARGVKCKNISGLQKILLKHYLDSDDALIFATEQINPVIDHQRMNAIKHGIYCDLPTR